MNTSVTGVQTSRDDLVIDFKENELIQRMNYFCDKTKTDDEIRRMFFSNRKSGKYLPGDSREWSLSNARKNLLSDDHRDKISNISYRPFDIRKIYYDSNMIDWPREDIMQFMLRDNVGLIIGRQGQVCGDNAWNLAYITNTISDLNVFYRGGGMLFPLYIYNSDTLEGKERIANLDQIIISDFAEKIGCQFISDHESSEAGKDGTFNPLDVLDYIYAVLHTPSYRIKYKEFLKIDFPRIPYPASKEIFFALAQKGSILRSVHLMQSDILDQTPVVFEGDGDNTVEKPAFKDGSVFINKTQHFANVTENSWNFYIGGYQPLQKYLKDRKGRTLTQEEVSHYCKVVKAIMETEKIMAELNSIWEV